MRRLVSVLIDNAVKYAAPDGAIQLTLNAAGKHAVLTVENPGEPIPPEKLSHIFDRFYRVDKARSRETGGTGLGLSIVKHAVAYHHGTVTLDSREGEGTTFTLRLPLEA